MFGDLLQSLTVPEVAVEGDCVMQALGRIVHCTVFGILGEVLRWFFCVYRTRLSHSMWHFLVNEVTLKWFFVSEMVLDAMRQLAWKHSNLNGIMADGEDLISYQMEVKPWFCVISAVGCFCRFFDVLWKWFTMAGEEKEEESLKRKKVDNVPRGMAWGAQSFASARISSIREKDPSSVSDFGRFYINWKSIICRIETQLVKLSTIAARNFVCFSPLWS